MRGQAPKIAACQKASRKTCDYRWEWLGRRYFCSAALTCGPQERGYGLPAVPIRRDAVLAKVRSQQFGEWPVSASAGPFPALRLQQRARPTDDPPRDGEGGGGSKRTDDRRLQGAADRRDAGQLALDAAEDQ